MSQGELLQNISDPWPPHHIALPPLFLAPYSDSQVHTVSWPHCCVRLRTFSDCTCYKKPQFGIPEEGKRSISQPIDFFDYGQHATPGDLKCKCLALLGGIIQPSGQIATVKQVSKASVLTVLKTIVLLVNLDQASNCLPWPLIIPLGNQGPHQASDTLHYLTQGTSSSIYCSKAPSLQVLPRAGSYLQSLHAL